MNRIMNRGVPLPPQTGTPAAWEAAAAKRREDFAGSFNRGVKTDRNGNIAAGPKHGDRSGHGINALMHRGDRTPLSTTPRSFSQAAPRVMRRLMSEHGLSKEQAAAVLGHLGHESAGFSAMQERRPIVKGSRGGFGWAQWTGPRRRAFEAYASANRLDPRSEEANLGYLLHELRQPGHARHLQALKNANTPLGRIKAFFPYESGGDRRAVKAFGSRQKWAQRALAAYNAAIGTTPSTVAGGSTPSGATPQTSTARRP